MIIAFFADCIVPKLPISLVVYQGPKHTILFLSSPIAISVTSSHGRMWSIIDAVVVIENHSAFCHLKCVHSTLCAMYYLRILLILFLEGIVFKWYLVLLLALFRRPIG